MIANAELPGPGAVLGKYRIERLLGEGVMGVVYEAVHTRLGQRVAIKLPQPLILQHPVLVDRFEREARAAARLRHRNSVRVIDVDVTESGIPYMVMELLHGRDLESELAERGTLPVAEAVDYAIQACAAMDEAHDRGIVHRDLKPSNMFVSTDADGTVCLKVLDFGISKIQSENVRITATQLQMGTPVYMSPEQVRSSKHVDKLTDVWSMGVILYELLAGTPPFSGSATGIGAAIVTDTPKSLRELRSDVDPVLEAIIAQAMSKDPAKRFSTMRIMIAALVPFSSRPNAIDILKQSAARNMSTPPSDEESAVRGTLTLAGTIGQAVHQSTSVLPGKGKMAKIATAALAALVLIGIAVFAVQRMAKSGDSPASTNGPATPQTPGNPERATLPAPATSIAAIPARSADNPTSTAVGEERPRIAAGPRPRPAAVQAPPKSAVHTTAPPPAVRPPDPVRKGWDNDSPLPPP